MSKNNYKHNIKLWLPESIKVLLQSPDVVCIRSWRSCIFVLSDTFGSLAIRLLMCTMDATDSLSCFHNCSHLQWWVLDGFQCIVKSILKIWHKANILWLCWVNKGQLITVGFRYPSYQKRQLSSGKSQFYQMFICLLRNVLAIPKHLGI